MRNEVYNVIIQISRDSDPRKAVFLIWSNSPDMLSAWFKRILTDNDNISQSLQIFAMLLQYKIKYIVHRAGYFKFPDWHDTNIAGSWTFLQTWHPIRIVILSNERVHLPTATVLIFHPHPPTQTNRTCEANSYCYLTLFQNEAWPFIQLYVFRDT